MVKLCRERHINFCKYVFVYLCVTSVNGQTQRALNTTQESAATKPVENDIYQTKGFDSDAVSSGPILIVDKKTIFISNLNYDNKNDSTFFWVGTGEPSEQGVLVPDENNSENPLKVYEGRNIYLHLPNNWTTDRIDYIAIWSVTNKTDLGYVELYQNVSDIVRNSVPDALGFHEKTKEGKTISRIPGCCGRNELRINKTCIRTDKEITTNLKVFASNETHIDPEIILEDVEFVPYKYFIDCPAEGYDAFVIIDEDAPGLIYNSSLIYYFDGYDHGLLPHGRFCVAYPDTQTHKIFVCLKKTVERQTASVQYLYFPFLIISTLCFLGSAIIYVFILKAKDVHKKCFVGYSSSMVITFVALIFLQKLNAACNFMGGLFLFFMMCSFVWLACLCLDLIFVIKKQSYMEDQARIYIYCALSFAIPAIILIGSLVPDGIPDVPESFVKSYYGANTCSFGEVSIEAFFVPVGLLITASLIGLGYTSYMINSRNSSSDFDWIHNKKNYKFMLRSCFLIWVTTFIWLIEASVNLIQMGSAMHLAIDLIEALQGVFVAIIFVLNKYTKKEIKKVIYKKQNKIEDQKRYAELIQALESNDTDNNCERTQNT